MANPTPAPHTVVTVTQAQIILDGVAYGDAVSSVTIVPTTATQSWAAVSGRGQQKNGSTSYAANVTLGQDYDTAALFRYLWENEGKTAALEVQPLGGTGPSFKATVNSLPVPTLGGAADTIATADVVLPLAGKPAVTWAAPAGG